MDAIAYLIEIIIWVIIMSLIGAAIGARRGRGEAGFLFGLLLGPLGWVIILIGPDYRRKCPECGGILEGDYPKCKHCGATLKQSPTETQFSCPNCKTTLVLPTDTTKGTCPICNVEIDWSE